MNWRLSRFDPSWNGQAWVTSLPLSRLVDRRAARVARRARKKLCLPAKRRVRNGHRAHHLPLARLAHQPVSNHARVAIVAARIAAAPRGSGRQARKLATRRVPMLPAMSWMRASYAVTATQRPKVQRQAKRLCGVRVHRASQARRANLVTDSGLIFVGAPAIAARARASRAGKAAAIPAMAIPAAVVPAAAKPAVAASIRKTSAIPDGNCRRGGVSRVPATLRASAERPARRRR